MDGLDLVRREHFQGREGIADRPPGQLPQMPGGRASASAALASSTSFHAPMIAAAPRPDLWKADGVDAPERTVARGLNGKRSSSDRVVMGRCGNVSMETNRCPRHRNVLL